MVTNPRRIFSLPEQPDTWIEVDPDAEYEIRAADAHTRCGWTPFEGRRVRGRVERVVLRGQVAYENGKVARCARRRAGCARCGRSSRCKTRPTEWTN